MHKICVFSSKKSSCATTVADTQKTENHTRKTHTYYVILMYRCIIINIIKAETNRKKETAGCGKQAALYFAKSAKNA